MPSSRCSLSPSAVRKMKKVYKPLFASLTLRQNSGPSMPGIIQSLMTTSTSSVLWKSSQARRPSSATRHSWPNFSTARRRIIRETASSSAMRTRTLRSFRELFEGRTHPVVFLFQSFEQLFHHREVARGSCVLQLGGDLAHPPRSHVARRALQGVGGVLDLSRVALLDGLAQGRQAWLGVAHEHLDQLGEDVRLAVLLELAQAREDVGVQRVFGDAVTVPGRFVPGSFGRYLGFPRVRSPALQDLVQLSGFDG